MYRTIEPELLPTAFDSIPHADLAALAAELRTARRDAACEHASPSWAADVDPLSNNDLDWPTCPDGSFAHKFDLAPDEERVVTKICETLNAEYISHGVARVCIRPRSLEDVVLKFGRWGPDILTMSGRHQNLFEAYVYDKWNATHSPPLLPVIAIARNGSWVLQPEATTLTDQPTEGKSVSVPWHPIRRRMWWQTRELHSLVFFEGFQPHNVGRWHDQWYVFDYARPRVKDSYHSLTLEDNLHRHGVP